MTGDLAFFGKLFSRTAKPGRRVGTLALTVHEKRKAGARLSDSVNQTSSGIHFQA
jgi:hypothetical protein